MKKISVALLTMPIVLGLASPAAAARKPAAKLTAAEQQMAKLPARFTRQALHWKPCQPRNGFWDGVQCTLLTVPLNYANPGGRTIKVAIDRSLSERGGKNLGLLMTNPGGPGGYGLSMAPLLANGAKVPEAIHAAYDVIGMNPRGVGPSPDRMGSGATKLTCASRPVGYPPPAVPAAFSPVLTTLADQARAREAACQATAEGIRPYITTMNTARDIDLLRMVLRKNKINYFGVSYGTWLGAVYGALFPGHLNRMVLDGSLDPRLTWYAGDIDGNQTRLANFDAFASWAVATNQGLGTTPRAIRTAVDDLYARLASSGTTIGGYTAGRLSKDIEEFTRYRPLWRDFAASLRNAVSAENGGHDDLAISQDVASASALVPAPSETTPEAEPLGNDDVYAAVTCEWSWPPPDHAGYAEYNRNITYWQRTFPYGSAVYVMGPSPCTYLTYKRTEAIPVIKSRGSYPRGLVVSSDGDVQTPLSTARGMARTLGFDLVTVTNDGAHGLTYKGSKCVDTAVTDYLLRGRLPGNRTCPTATGPGKTSLTAGAKAVAAQARD